MNLNEREKRNMKTVINEIDKMSIQDFADINNLTMLVNERPVPAGSGSRYYARFSNVDVLDGSFLVGESGNGSTPEEAIKKYANQISFKTIVSSATSIKRKEIKVPRLTYEAQDDS
jgi:hypothetical protein